MSITAVVASVPDAVDAPATVAQDDMRGAQQGPNPNDTGPLTSYRLFVTDSRGRIASMAKEVQGFSDEDAFAKAVEMVGQVNFELWERDRRVATPGHGERDVSRPGD